MTRIPANGLEFEVRMLGREADPAILLIMGLGRQLISWPDALIDGLIDAGYRVICFDNRDIGLSSKLEWLGPPRLFEAILRRWLRLPVFASYTLADMSEDCAGLLKSLGIARAHILGVSMGGMIAQIFAAAYPQMTLSLTSIMSSSGARGLPDARLPARRALMARPPPTQDREALVAHFVHVLKVIGSPGFPTPEAVLREQARASIERSYYPIGTARQLAAVIANGDRSPLLRRIRAPSLVIHGEEDPLVPVRCGEDTAKKIDGAKLLRILGMGHDLAPGLAPLLLEAIRAHIGSARKTMVNTDRFW